MRFCSTAVTLLALLFAAPSVRSEEPLRLSGKTGEIQFRPGDGAILFFGRRGANESIFHSGEAGLWEARLQDGRVIKASEFSQPGRSVECRREPDGQSLRMQFHGRELDVSVTAKVVDDAMDLAAEVAPHEGVLLSFGLPARLEFAPDRLVRLVCPANGNESVGFGFRGAFFLPRERKGPKAPAYYEYRSLYPAAFADFFHWETTAGLAAVYRVQPRPWEPWQAAQDRQAIFIPGQIACGGSAQGGWCERPFSPFIPAGRSWRTPAVRIAFGGTAAESLRAYCQANGITRRLEEKMTAEALEKFKQAVLVYYCGNCQQKLAHLEQLPRPTLVHFADYLHGGFDKQYPDHLPPATDFGTPQEFRALFERARQLGHLVMPYTNPTWWCDKPRGPTFLEHGEAPLLRLLDGRLSFERYAKNEGFTICHWHPAVQAANRKTVAQFSQEYPVDILFQDQCGARSWRYDANPASPTPYAYVEGLLSMIDEDCRRKPLSTESGWDGVVNAESQLCGMTWGIVPTEHGPTWRRLMKDRYDPATWEVFPLAQYIAHDKTSMIHHDLGQFVTNRPTLAWTLGLGFGLSWRTDAAGLDHEPPRQWLLWLDRLQKSVCARYVGRPLDQFQHDRGAKPTVDDGLIRASYGDLHIVANLGPHPREESGRTLAPFGFLATAPGLVAANLHRLDGEAFGESGVSFVSQEASGQTDLWVYAPAEQQVRILLPSAISGEATVKFDDGSSQAVTVREGICGFRLPAAPGRPRISPPAEMARAPRDWPGAKPAIGVLDFGAAVTPVWTRITPKQWLEAFSQSRLAKEWGLPVRPITNAADLAAALESGPRACLAIINPYGERFPLIGGAWREALDKIRAYVNQGGCWWETGGYSFHSAFAIDGQTSRFENVGPQGMQHLGLPVGFGEVDQPAEPLFATDAGRRWLGEPLSARVGDWQAPVNRALPRGIADPGHLTLISGKNQDYVGGYRLDGWGWLWRVGGFWPDREATPAVVVGAMEHLYSHAPESIPTGGISHLWHATVAKKL
jgi:hypothetical protein